MVKTAVIAFLLTIQVAVPGLARDSGQGEPAMLRVPLTAWLAGRPHVSPDTLGDFGFDPISSGRFAEALTLALEEDMEGGQ